MTTSLLLWPHGKTMFWSLFKKQVKSKFTPGTVFPLLADLWQDQCSLDGSASLIRWAAVCEWRSLLFVWFSMTLFLSLSDGLPLQGIILLQIVQLVWVASGFILLMSLLILFRSVFSRNRVILKPEYFFCDSGTAALNSIRFLQISWERYSVVSLFKFFENQFLLRKFRFAKRKLLQY